MVNRITEKEAHALRRFMVFETMPDPTKEVDYGRVMFDLGQGRFWLPIEYATASGRATCRLCGETIEKPERCIAFQFDAYGGKDRFSRALRAYLHTNCTGGKL